MGMFRIAFENLVLYIPFGALRTSERTDHTLYKQQAYFGTIDEQVSLEQNVRFDKLAPGILC